MACPLEVAFKRRRVVEKGQSEKKVRSLEFADGTPVEARTANGVSEYIL